MEFRIGVNLGDVMVDGEQIYGDRVNVAARLGGVLICFFSLAALRSRDVILTRGVSNSSGQTTALASASSFLPAFSTCRLRMDCLTVR